MHGVRPQFSPDAGPRKGGPATLVPGGDTAGLDSYDEPSFFTMMEGWAGVVIRAFDLPTPPPSSGDSGNASACSFRSR